MKIHPLYYRIKPLIPRRIQIILRRNIVLRKKRDVTNFWPIREDVPGPPPGFTGWPENKKFALLITHDVESRKGTLQFQKLMNLDLSMGFRSSFNWVPEKYTVDRDWFKLLVRSGFEVGVHGLRHDGRLYHSYQTFQQRASKINRYLRDWNAVGFRSPSMHHNLEWIQILNIKYDSSTFDTDPFEPQPDAAGSIFPFWVSGSEGGRGYVELPYTLPQDFTLFVLMQEKNIEIWKKKLDWLVERGGMALVGVHPDYLNFNQGRVRFDEYPVKYYIDFLTYIRERYRNSCWNPLPRELASFWKSKVVQSAGKAR